ncbi:TPA: IS200/IS605 family transposase [Enterococcus faecium]|uniref:IS200/IS605 family transposase n=1 Tax=Enterococcus faecium TaxID=1352 RepID=UPI0022DE5CC4|nr:IS200/IS605 family transposase [Enterococcus faecium]MDQ8242452.1 IS200/IS605 family transposase [Enterococcus faecium]MDQ8244881.1 IS200/IS605 family transposase [Enterococcus faecium]MDQ8301534.1 IS200/IS605 family transposase [Enterococcus faecium]MDQ8397482.1 IS200/IS605 family transposase [Enterococcus faecium]MDQ8448477.1 IS200/IS605 family transposase [Enterococcus faecium]
MDNEYRHSKTTVSLVNYHFVFCPRYRRKIFVNSEVDARFKALVQEIAKENEWNIIAIETDKDYCHLLINVQPTYSPSKIMKIIKGKTSRIIRQEFEHLSKMPSVWTRSYFVSTAGNVSSEIIKRYVENQRTRY